MIGKSFRSSARSPRLGKTTAGRRLRRHNRDRPRRRRGGKAGFAKKKCAFCRGEARMILGGVLRCGKPHATRPGWK